MGYFILFDELHESKQKSGLGFWECRAQKNDHPIKKSIPAIPVIQFS